MKNSNQDRLAHVEAAVREVAASLGLEVVELAFHSRGKHSQLRIDIDRAGPAGVGLQDCEAMSRALDSRLETIDFFDAPYELQVSSPGLDRPIRTDDDLRRNEGRLVRVEFRDLEGRMREVSGTLRPCGPEGSVRIEDGDAVIAIPRDRISLLKQEVTSKGRGRPDR